MRRLFGLVMAVVVVACRGEPAADPDCILADGTELVGGERLSDRPCMGCDARTGELRQAWGEGCGGSRVLEVPESSPVGQISLGPDVDGDGLGDVAISSQFSSSAGGSNRGRVEVYSSATGELLFDVEGDRDHLMLSKAVLGPDISGDGLADLLVSSANSYHDIEYIDDEEVRGGAPNPGLVIAFDPIGGRELRRWEGELPCQSLGSAIDLGPDANGDGLGEILIVDRGCGEVSTPPAVPRSASMRVFSGLSDLQIVRVEHPSVASFGRGSLATRQGHTLLAYEVAATFDTQKRVRQVDLSTGEVVLDFAPIVGAASRQLPATFGYDFTGDGNPDSLASIRDSSLDPPTGRSNPIIVYPNMMPPVGTDFSIVGHSLNYQAFEDADGDGRDDVLIYQPFSVEGRGRFALVAPDGEELYALDDLPLPDEPFDGRNVWHVSRPFDMDGDGCLDFAALVTNQVFHGPERYSRIEIEIHRCAGW